MSVEADSGLAILVSVDGVRVWLPKSQIDDDSEVYEMGTEGQLVIPEWLALEKGMI